MSRRRFLALALLLAVPLAACGKKGALKPPPGEDAEKPKPAGAGG